MTDRELLELAAKAAGIDCDAQLDDGTVVTAAEAPSFWNPLTDDGDAMRLAVRLNITVDVNRVDGVTTAEYGYFKRDGLQELHADNPYAATRRAIVRAAAEIGRSME